jgi:hypothetical protein
MRYNGNILGDFPPIQSQRHGGKAETRSADVTGRDLWKLIDSVRDRSCDLFTLDEKQKMHNLVVRLKTKGTISPADFEWLKQYDEALRCMGAPRATASKRRRVFARRRRANG